MQDWQLENCRCVLWRNCCKISISFRCSAMDGECTCCCPRPTRFWNASILFFFRCIGCHYLSAALFSKQNVAVSAFHPCTQLIVLFFVFALSVFLSLPLSMDFTFVFPFFCNALAGTMFSGHPHRLVTSDNLYSRFQKLLKKTASFPITRSDVRCCQFNCTHG